MEYTIVENFNIHGESRLQEFKEFLTTNMRNSSLRVPIELKNDSKTFSVSLSSNIKDVLLLEALFDTWAEDDKQLAKDDAKQITWLQKLFRILN